MSEYDRREVELKLLRERQEQLEREARLAQEKLNLEISQIKEFLIKEAKELFVVDTLLSVRDALKSLGFKERDIKSAKDLDLIKSELSQYKKNKGKLSFSESIFLDMENDKGEEVQISMIEGQTNYHVDGSNCKALSLQVKNLINANLLEKASLHGFEIKSKSLHLESSVNATTVKSKLHV